ncbi:MAG: diaminopimelate decarboxylase [Desulfovibrionaceae bacterium]|nr:diaminopimelate decarboxylase [Desulfovibrionaceae bacterium]
MSFAPHLEDQNFFGQTTAQQLAEAFGTPLYIYNERILRQNCKDLLSLSSHPGFGVNYSVKANANLFLLKIIREEGLVVDAMSPGELYLDELAGFSPDKILYISNNNDRKEMANALAHGLIVSVDSLDQLAQLGELNPHGKVMVRFNPGIGQGHSDKVITAGKHTKFGILPENLPEVLNLLKEYDLKLVGVNQHIGSLFMEPTGYLSAAQILLDLVEKLPAKELKTLQIIDFGGGFGIPYHKHQAEPRLDFKTLGAGLHQLISDFAAKYNYQGRFLVEPGRYVMAEASVLLGEVTAIKSNVDKNFVGTNLGFNVLMRPVLYDSYHEIEVFPKDLDFASKTAPFLQTVTGNICESGDILAKDRLLPPLQRGDLLVALDSGAYGFSMASGYNQRLRPAELLITKQGQAKLIRKRESLEDLSRGFQGLS